MILRRISDNGKDTIGLLTAECEAVGFTMEDTYRSKKVQGETRIPAGVYEIKFREVLSGLTKEYRKRFPWFTWHLELQDVPGFKYVYIHVGNFAKDTDGCILIADGVDGLNKEDRMITNSVKTFKDFYKYVQKKLHKKESVFITIKDEQQWL